MKSACTSVCVNICASFSAHICSYEGGSGKGNDSVMSKKGKEGVKGETFILQEEDIA